MTITTQIVAKKIQETPNQPIRLTSLFPDHLKDGKLYLDKIDFFALSPRPILCDIDFSNCVITNSDFSYLLIARCNFTDCEFAANNIIKGISVEQSNFPVTVDVDSEEIEFQWFKKMWHQYPQDVFSYENLEKNAQSGLIGYIAPFYAFVYPENKGESYGWKLHLSINPLQLEQAFNLVAPIIAQYHINFKLINLAKVNLKNRLRELLPNEVQFPYFHDASNETFNSYEEFFDTCKKSLFTDDDNDSVSDIKEKQIWRSYQRFYESTPITIYLENGGKTLPQEQALQMINEATALLEKNGISPGKNANSDAPSISPYFSLRNDKFEVPIVFKSHEKKYLSANEVGDNYNPTNLSNPYDNLLPKSEPFDLMKNFTNFPKRNNLVALSYSLLAYLREYTKMDPFEENKLKKFLQQCFSEENSAVYTCEFIKNFGKENTPNFQDIKTIFLLCAWTFSEIYENETQQIHEAIKFSPDYPFSDFLKNFINVFNTGLIDHSDYLDKGESWKMLANEYKIMSEFSDFISSSSSESEDEDEDEEPYANRNYFFNGGGDENIIHPLPYSKILRKN